MSVLIIDYNAGNSMVITVEVVLGEPRPGSPVAVPITILEFHHTPNHASWLNMAEIEFSALPETACRNAEETTWHWLEQSTPMRSDATPLGPPSTGVSAPMM